MDDAPVGVLLDRIVLRAARNGRPTYENLRFYRQFARSGVCFFSFDGVDLANERVRAYAFDADGRLTKRNQPLPRVIHYRAIASNPRDRQLAGTLARLPDHHVFNHPFCGGKLRNCQWLAEDPELRAHVPETRRYRGAKTLAALLARHPAVVLKPIWGSLGLGLIRIRRARGGDFTWETGTGGQRHCRTVAAISRAIRKRTAVKSYLAQQWLDLAAYQGHRFDVRASIQRGGDGNWRVSGLTAKVGGHNRIATNVARGGRAVSLSKVLPAAFGTDADNCYERLSDLGLRIAATLAKHEPRAADYGLDLCLTKDGRPWFLEANHRDLRYSFRDAGDRYMWSQTYRNPMRYAAYLATGQSVGVDRK